MHTICPECQAEIALPDGDESQPIRCPQCHAILQPQDLEGADAPLEIIAPTDDWDDDLDLSDLDELSGGDRSDPERPTGDDDLDDLDDLNDLDDLDDLNDLDDLDDLDDLNDLALKASDTPGATQAGDAAAWREPEEIGEPPTWDDAAEGPIFVDDDQAESSREADSGAFALPADATAETFDDVTDMETGGQEVINGASMTEDSGDLATNVGQNEGQGEADEGDESDHDGMPAEASDREEGAPAPFQYVAAGTQKMSAAPPVPRRSNILVVAVKALLGGIAAMVLLQLLCWWLLGMDPLGLGSQVPPSVAFVVPPKIRKMYGLLPTQQIPLRPDIVTGDDDEEETGNLSDETHLDSLAALEEAGGMPADTSEQASRASEFPVDPAADGSSQVPWTSLLAGVSLFDADAVTQRARGTAGFHEMLLQAMSEKSSGIRNVARQWYTQYCELAKSATLADSQVPRETRLAAREMLNPIAQNDILLSLVETSAAGWLHAPETAAAAAAEAPDASSMRGVLLAGTVLATEATEATEAWIRGRLKLADKKGTEVTVVGPRATMGLAGTEAMAADLPIGSKLLLMGVQLFAPARNLPEYTGEEPFVVLVTDLWIELQ